MIVWIVTAEYASYYGQQIMGVYKTRSAARKRKANILARKENFYFNPHVVRQVVH